MNSTNPPSQPSFGRAELRDALNIRGSRSQHDRAKRNQVARSPLPANILYLLIVLLLPPAGPLRGQSSNQAQDSMVFRNGDLLYGQLLAIDEPATVRWQHADVADAIDFAPAGIAEIDFPPLKNATAHPADSCRVFLASGDTLTGNLVACDHNALTLQTWYAGQLTLPRGSLQTLAFIPRAPAQFDGITSMDGWTQGSNSAFAGETGNWVYRNGAFYASKPASIARNLNLPDVAEIQFDLAWKGSLNLAVALYTDSLQPILLTAKERAPDFGGFYSLRFNDSTFIDMWPIKKIERLRPLGQLFIPSLNNKDRLHVNLRVSKPQHKFALYLDDTPVKEWDDPEGFIGEGTGVRFVQNAGSILKLSNLRVTEWDGVFEAATSTETDTTHDAYSIKNHPRATCSVESIASGKLTATTTNGPVEIPIDEVSSIDFAHHAVEPSQAHGATVRAVFVQGGTMTFTLESWRPNEMIVRSPDFGKAKINPAAFSRLQFVIPEKKPAEGPKG